MVTKKPVARSIDSDSDDDGMNMEMKNRTDPVDSDSMMTHSPMVTKQLRNRPSR